MAAERAIRRRFRASRPGDEDAHVAPRNRRSMAAGMTRSTRQRYAALALLAAIGLSSCGPMIPPAPRPTFTPATPRPTQSAPAQPERQDAAGIIGSEARGLVRLFGEPRLDIRDPAARKLQFSNGRCIVDTYLYPSRTRREPVVAYAEARTMDGTTMDVTACADQLKAR
jgi:hypothetical protein